MYLLKNRRRPLCLYPDGRKCLAVFRGRPAVKRFREMVTLPRCWVATATDSEEIYRSFGRMKCIVLW